MSDMRRREFITFLGGTAAAWPLAARAQQAERMRRIGVLMAISEDDPQARARVAVFRQALADLSWTEGRNLKIEGNGDNSRSVSIINQDGVATAIRILVMVQADQARSRADGTGAYDYVVDAIHRQVATEQPRIEQVRLEGDHGLYGFVLSSVNGIPAEIGADIDEDAP